MRAADKRGGIVVHEKLNGIDDGRQVAGCLLRRVVGFPYPPSTKDMNRRKGTKTFKGIGPQFSTKY